MKFRQGYRRCGRNQPHQYWQVVSVDDVSQPDRRSRAGLSGPIPTLPPPDMWRLLVRRRNINWGSFGFRPHAIS
jgi:hypothetical protein